MARMAIRVSGQRQKHGASLLGEIAKWLLSALRVESVLTTPEMVQIYIRVVCTCMAKIVKPVSEFHPLLPAREKRAMMMKSSSVVIAIVAISALVLLTRFRLVNYSNIFDPSSPRVGNTSGIGSGNTTMPIWEEEEEEELTASTTIREETNSSRTDVVGEDAATSVRRRPAVSFVPFPHNTLGSGIDMECAWETRPILLAAGDEHEYDSTQRAAFDEGICVPPILNASIHVYSSSEAKECLRYRRVIISGDSYMKQLFIGLADILLSKKLNGDREIIGRAKRSAVVASANRWLAGRRNKDASFPHVEYRCEMECYGYPENAPFGEVCAGCINPLTSRNNGNATVAVVGAGVHIGGVVDGEIRKFLDLAVRTVFVPMPAANKGKNASKSLRV